MSELFDLSQEAPLADGTHCPAGSIAEPELAKRLKAYKRQIASRYRALSAEEIETLPKGGLWVSPKIDGELWFLIVDGEEVALVSYNGKVIRGDIPVLAEARKFVQRRAEGRTILAGELFAIRSGGRPRVGDLRKARSGGADAPAEKMGFQVFDLLEGGDSEAVSPMPAYEDRLRCFERLCKGGKRLQAIKTVHCASHDKVKDLFSEWVEGGKGEGIVVRSEEIGRIYKVKPIFTLDAAVIAFTERADEEKQVRSLLLALIREDGRFQVIGSCGNLGTPEHRAKLYEKLAEHAIPSGYSYASSSGALFKFVRPTMVVEVKLTDVQGEDSSGDAIKRMVLELGAERWTAIAPAKGISILHPVLARVRDDKDVNALDVRAAQVLERVHIDDLDQAVEKVELAKSEVLRREVYTKTTKGNLAVRKVLLWKTNKEIADPTFPAFVVHWTDYSPGRKDPLKRDVRTAPSLEAAEAIADEMVAAGVKKGWDRADA